MSSRSHWSQRPGATSIVDSCRGVRSSRVLSVEANPVSQTATVTYDVLFGGTAAYTAQSGTLTRIDGVWTVAKDEPHPINAPFTLERFTTGRLIDEAAAAAVAH